MKLTKLFGIGLFMAMSSNAFAGGRSNETTLSDVLLNPSLPIQNQPAVFNNLLDATPSLPRPVPIPIPIRPPLLEVPRLPSVLISAAQLERIREILENARIEQCLIDEEERFKPALVFNNAESLEQNDSFKFSNVLNQLIASSPAPQTLPKDFMQSMLDSFALSSAVNENIGMKLDQNRRERDMDPERLIKDLKPVAAFNRFDLAAVDGSHCGEHRIVYARETTSIFQRFFLILEAQYPNPLPELGFDGCAPIANFWANLRAKDDTTIVAQLGDFFFHGVTHDRVNLPPVIDYKHFVKDVGQVRGNFFMNRPGARALVWQLREFHTAMAGSKTVFEIDTVKTNPLVELYSNANAVLGQIDNSNLNQAVAEARAEAFTESFQQDFVDKYIAHLLKPELTGLSSASDVINSIGFHPDKKFNEFQSNAGPHNFDLPNVASNSTFAQEIDAKLQSFDISRAQLINRANAMTCSGCHQTANNASIAPGVNWPSSLDFVHVDESGALSEALLSEFLPARKKVLETYRCGTKPYPYAQSVDNFEAQLERRHIVKLSWEGIEDKRMCDSYRIQVLQGSHLFREFNVDCDSEETSLFLPAGGFTISINGVFSNQNFPEAPQQTFNGPARTVNVIPGLVPRPFPIFSPITRL